VLDLGNFRFYLAVFISLGWSTPSVCFPFPHRVFVSASEHTRDQLIFFLPLDQSRFHFPLDITHKSLFWYCPVASGFGLYVCISFPHPRFISYLGFLHRCLIHSTRSHGRRLVSIIAFRSALPDTQLIFSLPVVAAQGRPDPPTLCDARASLPSFLLFSIFLLAHTSSASIQFQFRAARAS
jgi:hypothetical protein